MTLATGFGAIFIVTDGYLHNAEERYQKDFLNLMFSKKQACDFLLNKDSNKIKISCAHTESYYFTFQANNQYLSRYPVPLIRNVCGIGSRKKS